MKIPFALFVVSACAAAVQLSSCSQSNPPAEEKTETTAAGVANLMSDDQMIKRGEYLVVGSGCSDCHAPKKFTDMGPQPDMDLWLSGHPAESKLPPSQPAAVKAGWVLMGPDFTAFVGPWGTSFAANLTPDTATGIGTWTETNFFTAIRKGKFHGLEASRSLLPPMPWQNFSKFSDEDLRAIFLYLKSIKPVSNAVPAPIPPGA
jgi:hypothetical protein